MTKFSGTPLSTNAKSNDLSETILKVVIEKRPQSVEELTTILKGSGFKEKEILQCIQKLQSEGQIKLEDVASSPSNVWYMLTIVAGSLTSILIFVISGSLYPWVYLRNVLGLLFVLFLPGYAFVKAFFRVKNLDKTLEAIMKIALSVGLSIAIVSLVGLLLYYSPFGLNLSDIVLSLFLFTSAFATVALLRDRRDFAHLNDNQI